VPLGITTFSSEYLEGTTVTFCARAVGADGTILSSAGGGDWEVTSYSVEVYDLDAAPRTPIYQVLDATAVTDVVQVSASSPSSSDLLTDGYWSIDDIGYNVRLTLAPKTGTDASPSGDTDDNGDYWEQVGGSTHLIELTLDTATWGQLRIANRVKILASHGRD